MLRHANATLDATACAAIYAPFVTDGATSFEDVAPAAGELARRIERVSATHAWLVAERDGLVVGFAYAAPHHERAAYRWTVNTAVYVDAEHQRQGVGRELYAALLPLLCDQRLHVACAGITLPNPASVTLHESFGFEPLGVYRRIGFKAGAWRDVAWLQLDLAGTDDAPQEPLGPRRLPGA